MIFNTHSRLVGTHAFLSASKYHWVNYDLSKLDQTYRNSLAAQRGVELHAFANEAIRLGIKLPRSERTLNHYVNDAIGFRMSPEQVLYYSDNCYATADAISFQKNTLRIHDLKTGVTKASFIQLMVYAALFCLEYGFKPFDIEIILRIYQNDEVAELIPEKEEIVRIISQIVMFDRHIDSIKQEV